MRFVFFAFICALGALQAQTSATSLRPGGASTPASGGNTTQTTGRSAPKISVPTLGFLVDPSGAGLTLIRGIASAPSLGETIPKPNGAGGIYLPPRQHYALVEQPSSETMAVWHLAYRHIAASGDMLDSIQGTLAHPDLVVFSPKGSAVVLLSKAQAKLQVIAGLPGNPTVKAEISTSVVGQLANVAVSDDGQTLLGLSSMGQMSVSSDGTTMRNLPGVYSPIALTFVANTHNLIISDGQQKQLILIQSPEGSAVSVVLGNDLQPDHLATSADGETLFALDTAHQKLWEIDTTTFTVTPVPLSQPANMLATLRDGHTFLLSTSPLSLLKAADSGSSPQVLVHSGVTPAVGGKQ